MTIGWIEEFVKDAKVVDAFRVSTSEPDANRNGWYLLWSCVATAIATVAVTRRI